MTSPDGYSPDTGGHGSGRSRDPVEEHSHDDSHGHGEDRSPDRGDRDGGHSHVRGDDSHGTDDHRHGHDDGHSHDHAVNASTRALLIALGINTAFFAVELVGAWLADSLTLFADAAHMLTDSASLGLALFAAWVAARPADTKRTYGYHRAEVLGALANGLFLLGVVGYILFEAYQRFQDPQSVDATLVIVVGVVGLVANLAAAWTLNDHRDSLNVEGAFLHLMADAAGSVAAIALGVALTLTDLYVLDPLFALLIAGLVLYSTKDLLSDSLNILLQGTPRDVDVERVADALDRVDGVEGVHDVHVWALDSTRTALSAHLVTRSGTDADEVLRRAQSVLGGEFGIDHATLQVESDDCVETGDFDCYPADPAA